MVLHITLNVHKKIAMKTMLGKQVADCQKELLTIMAGIKTHILKHLIERELTAPVL